MNQEATQLPESASARLMGAAIVGQHQALPEGREPPGIPMLDDAYRISRRAVERLVDGSVYEWSRDATGRSTWVADPDIEDDPHVTWAGLASAFETTGRPDWEGAVLVMDLERALHMLSRLHPDAATVVATRVMNDLSDDEMDQVMPSRSGRTNWRRLRAKACAWITAYLASATPAECESAYRRAR